MMGLVVKEMRSRGIYGC